MGISFVVQCGVLSAFRTGGADSLPVCVGGRLLYGDRLAGRTAAEAVKRRRGILASTILVNIGILFALKYVNFFINTADGIVSLFGGPKELLAGVDFLVPLGVSFYTFSLLGYVIDVYYGLAEHQKNFGKLALYGLYFPNLISGPI